MSDTPAACEASGKLVETPDDHSHATTAPPDERDHLHAESTFVKTEDGADTAPADDDATNPDITDTTLRSHPPPSTKRRESEAAETSAPDQYETKVKKRKRRESPPWQFPIAESTFAKTADGRRVSSRVNSSTPMVTSESEGGGRVRSGSKSANRSRQPSPPWKRFDADVPSTLSVAGQRKSGRVNKDLSQPTQPKRTSPRTKKTVDKAQTADAPSKKKVSAETRAQSPSARIAELQAQIAALKPTRSFPSPEPEVKELKSAHKRKRSSNVPHHATPDAKPSSPIKSRTSHRPSITHADDFTRPPPRIKLRFTGQRGLVPPPHPQARAPPPAHPPQLSLHQLIEGWELKEMQQPYMENERGPPDADEFRRRYEEQAMREGEMRRRLVQAGQPEGVLSRERCSLYQDEQQEEPAKQYGHVDHLTSHALYLRHLQIREKMAHRQMAKKIAQEALEYWKSMRGPTEEDLVAEQDRIFRMIYKQCVADVRGKWEMVEKHVQDLRRQRWEMEEDARRQERLQKQLEQAELMVAKQRGADGDNDSDVEMMDDRDEDSTGDVAGSETGEEDDGEDHSEEENMTSSESDAGTAADEDGWEMDQAELAAYLAQREVEPPDKADIPDLERRSSPSATGDAPGTAFLELDANRDIPGDSRDDVQVPEIADMLFQGGDEAMEEEDQQDYKPDSEQSISRVQDGTASLLLEAPTADARTRSRRSHSAAPAVEEEANDDLSDDESTDMYDSDDDMSSTGDEDTADHEGSQADDSGGDDDAEEAQNSMLALLFSGSKIKNAVGLPTPTTSAEGDARDRTTEPVSEEQLDVQSQAGATRLLEVEEVTVADMQAEAVTVVPREVVPDTAAEPVLAAAGGFEDDTTSTTHALDDDAIAPVDRDTSPGSPSASGPRYAVPVPSLLRGTLRSYQQAGLDWLASLHRNGTNGILADEMGLGKTIQTIALLAHLAEHKGIWETHLVIVPTSVILNWVTEFQKFLPGFRVLGYYGTAEERKIKRNHWVNDPHLEKDKRGYNVVVTSYNVAMQDINAIRGVQWHYLVLDEAHNIRNFNSQRWQVLIRLKTRARLLLTGTPLQNSLTELWSLLTFLTAGDDDPAHGDLEEFLSHWKEPVKEIFDRGVTSLSAEAQKVVDQLHISLRPFLLRRLKTEVEKDLPKKTESVVVCKLSKRQRQLYQEYMGLASTRDSLTRGNAVSAGKVLLSLRRVCNHPDLFDPRPIQTSYAMEQSPVQPFASKEILIRQLLDVQEMMPSSLMIAGHEAYRGDLLARSRQLDASRMLRSQVDELASIQNSSPEYSTLAGSLAFQRVRQRQRGLQHLRDAIQISTASMKKSPVYGSDLCELLTVRSVNPYAFGQRQAPSSTVLRAWPAFGKRPLQLEHRSDWYLSQSTNMQRDILTLDRLGEDLHEVVTRFAFCTPVTTAPILDHAVPARQQQLIRASDAYPVDSDFAHEARSRTSIVFPDSRLLIYDSGKLQRLSKLLRELQSRGSRSLIFTQMTGTLNILEQFLSLLNLPYLRLDGSTPVERRQIYAGEFNRPDSKYQCMILSSRAGGVGLNLTGASSVIFYDLDWNPQMDRQCMDRAHRIGQVRDVEVYKMVSEKTVEENILRRANQKSLLDQTVIQEGHFTTEYQHPTSQVAEEDEDKKDVEAAIERFLGGGDKVANQAIESVEDREDVVAAHKATAEEHQDDNDFAERSSKGPSLAPTPGPGLADDGEAEHDGRGHVDGYMVNLVEAMMKDLPFVPAPVRRLDKHGRDPSHRPKRKR